MKSLNQIPDALGFKGRRSKLRQPRKERERTIEKRCLRWLKQEYPRAKALKLNTWGHASWPDRALFLPGCRFSLVEFKRPGKVPTPDQALLHRELKRLGFVVHVVESLHEFQAAIAAT